MNVLSLFDGISCGRVALSRAGISVDSYHAYEICDPAIYISRKNWPDIVHMGDVTVAGFKQYYGIDLLMGGSPCQSLSIVQSKTRQHLDGKSKLFFEFVRSLEEAKPKWFLFENVASMNAESKAVISELLGCEPVFIDSGDFCAQERPRLYWTNIPLVDIDMTKQVCATMIHSNQDMHKRVFNPDFKCHTLTCVSGGNQQKKVLQDGRARKLTPLEYERLQTLPDNYTAGVADGHRYTAIGNGWTVDVIAWILSHIPYEEADDEWLK